MVNLATDADSLLYKALHRRTDRENLEWAYMEFCKELLNIEWAVNKEMGKEEINHLIVLSPAKSFRNRLTDTYKANRPEHDPRIKELKIMISERFAENVLSDRDAEADDIVVYLSGQGFLISAIDKDIEKAHKSMCLNYNTRKWSLEQSERKIELWYIYQTLLGDGADGIKGAKGIGKKTAEKFIKELSLGAKSYEDWIELFEDEETAIETMRLIRMDQWTPENGVVLWEPEDWKEG